MTPTLYQLALDAIQALGQSAYSVHEEMEKWREPPWSPIERTRQSSLLKSYIEKQYQWIEALRNHQPPNDP